MPVTSGPARSGSTTGPTVSVNTAGLSAGEALHAVVRPEKLRVELAGGGRPERPAAGRGDHRELALPGDLDADSRRPRRRRQDDRADRERREAERQGLPGGGARVALSWDPEHMHMVRESPASPDLNAPQRGEPRTADLEVTREGD